MTYKEAKTQLEELIVDRKSFLSNDKETNEIFQKDIDALEYFIKTPLNDQINELNNKIDAQDKIINTQALEIARLKEDLKDACLVIEKLKKEKENAIEYIHKRMVHEGEYWIRKAYHFKNTEYGKDLLEILGDKE